MSDLIIKAVLIFGTFAFLWWLDNKKTNKIQTLKQQLGESRERELAPVDSGIKELDGFCEKYNKGEMDLCDLVCRIWNTALTLNNPTGESDE